MGYLVTLIQFDRTNQSTFNRHKLDPYTISLNLVPVSPLEIEEHLAYETKKLHIYAQPGFGPQTAR